MGKRIHPTIKVKETTTIWGREIDDLNNKANNYIKNGRVPISSYSATVQDHAYPGCVMKPRYFMCLNLYEESKEQVKEEESDTDDGRIDDAWGEYYSRRGWLDNEEEHKEMFKEAILSHLPTR